MAKYNREFLVQYLADVCAVHIAEHKLEEKAKTVMNKHNRLLSDAEKCENNEPSAPEYVDTGFWMFGIVLGAILCLVSMFDILIISFLAGLAGWPLVIVSVIFYIKGKNANEEMEMQYQIAYENYAETANKSIDEYNNYLEVAYAQQVICDNERKKIRETLDKVYRANIIPLRYRNIYVALYLYDWFSTSLSDDLDAALSMFVLEEIKGRLDEMINLLEESLYNQRLIIDNQEKQIRMQQQHYDELVGKLDQMKQQMELTAEEQDRYLGMIAANTTVSAYFTAADYLRK